MYRQPQITAPAWLNAHTPPLLPARHSCPGLQAWLLADYQCRARSGLRWSDVGPAYLIAVQCHRACWPSDGDGWDDALAEHWEAARGDSRLDWSQARSIVQEAWHAIASLPGEAPATRRQ